MEALIKKEYENELRTLDILKKVLYKEMLTITNNELIELEAKKLLVKEEIRLIQGKIDEVRKEFSILVKKKAFELRKK